MAADGIDFAEVRRRVQALRKPELCECLERLGLRKSGNKPDLQQRLLRLFEDSYHLISKGHGPPRDMYRLTAAQRVIDDVYNKHTLYSGSGAGGAAEDAKYRGAAAQPHANGNTAAAAGSADALLSNAMPAFVRERAAVAATAAGAQVLRCCCGASGAASERAQLVQCRGCGIWQHRPCAGVATGGPGSSAAADGNFYCEMCRAKRADPFWEVDDGGITPPLRLAATGKQAPVNGSMQAVRSLERSFSLSSQHLSKIKARNSEYQLQLACLQVGDPVPFRFHWPLTAELRVNGVQYRVYSRNAGQKLGANARDETANIGQLWHSASGPPGRFQVSMQCADSSSYVMVVLLSRRRSVEEVQRLMAPQMSVRDAVERVRQLCRDDDEDVQTGATVLSLRCPILGTRVRTPARFAEVAGLACFDLGAFLDGAARTRKWQCPVSMSHSCVHSLMVDTYTQQIIRALADHPGVMEVEVDASGGWRPAGSRDRFFSVEEDNPLAAAAARANGGGGGDGSSEGEETDEEEELRRAAAAVSAAVGQKRKRAPSPDVIDLASSDEEDGGRGGGGGGGGGGGEGSEMRQQLQQPNGAVRVPDSVHAGGAAGTAAAGLPPIVTTGVANAPATAAVTAPLRITLTNRRVVTTAHGNGREQQQQHSYRHQQQQPQTTAAAATGAGAPGTVVTTTAAALARGGSQVHPHAATGGDGGGGMPGSAAAAALATPRAVVAAAGAGAAVLATQRQHFEQLAVSGLARHPSAHHPHPHPPQHHPHPAALPQQPAIGAPGQQQQPPPPPLPVGNANGVSHRQAVTATVRSMIRIRTAVGTQQDAAAAGSAGAAATPPQQLHPGHMQWPPSHSQEQPQPQPQHHPTGNPPPLQHQHSQQQQQQLLRNQGSYPRPHHAPPPMPPHHHHHQQQQQHYHQQRQDQQQHLQHHQPPQQQQPYPKQQQPGAAAHVSSLPVLGIAPPPAGAAGYVGGGGSGPMAPGPAAAASAEHAGGGAPPPAAAAPAAADAAMPPPPQPRPPVETIELLEDSGDES